MEQGMWNVVLGLEAELEPLGLTPGYAVYSL